MDAAFAHLATDYLARDEARLFTAPWTDVAGDIEGAPS